MEYYIGDPASQLDTWELQNMHDNCAVAAQTSIINQYLGSPISLEEANYVAVSSGIYTPGAGTSPADVGLLMDIYRVPNHSVEDASIEQLAAELQQGHLVVVGVDSGELWEEGPLGEFWSWLQKAFGLDTAEFNPADHAVVVTGINVSDPENPTVVINDPGHPEGAGKEYPLHKFKDAWENSNFHYVSTSEPPPGNEALPFDLGNLMGLGTTFAATAFLGADPLTAAAAGDLVNGLVSEFDWDKVLAHF
ncbi:MAG: C39 family peptidase [Verrucomicrobiales bacterium]